jgi:hypothetical protein
MKATDIAFLPAPDARVPAFFPIFQVFPGA